MSHVNFELTEVLTQHHNLALLLSTAKRLTERKTGNRFKVQVSETSRETSELARKIR